MGKVVLYGEKSFATFPDDFLYRDIEAYVWGTFLLPWNWDWIVNPLVGTNDRMTQVYDRLMFHGATFADLHRRGRPQISAIRFLSTLLGIAAIVLLVSVILWLLERRRTAAFGGPPVDGLVCSVSWSTQAMAKANPSVSPTTRPGLLLGGVWTAASVVLIAMFTAAVTSHLTARELSGLVRDAADLHHVRVGTVRDAVAAAYLDREGIHHQDFATIGDALRAVAAGQLDAVVYDKPILAWLVRQDHPNEVQMLDLRLAPQSYAIALPYDSPLRQKLNIALANTMRSSWWHEVVNRYVGAE
jgi:polar amino acid transport system substrate-binding protein